MSRCRGPAIGTKEQIAKRPTQQVRNSPLCQMIRTIVDDVATLTEALEIAPSVIAGVVIEVRRREYYAGLSYLPRFHEIRPPRPPAAAIAPSITGGIEPAPIGKTA